MKKKRKNLSTPNSFNINNRDPITVLVPNSDYWSFDVESGHTETEVMESVVDAVKRPVKCLGNVPLSVENGKYKMRGWVFKVIEKVWLGKMFGIWIKTTDPNK